MTINGHSGNMTSRGAHKKLLRCFFFFSLLQIPPAFSFSGIRVKLEFSNGFFVFGIGAAEDMGAVIFTDEIQIF